MQALATMASDKTGRIGTFLTEEQGKQPCTQPDTISKHSTNGNGTHEIQHSMKIHTKQYKLIEAVKHSTTFPRARPRTK